jgi:hypothetical protein
VRQVFTVRFVATIAALLGLLAALTWAVPRFTSADDDSAATGNRPPTADDLPDGLGAERRIDTIQLAFLTTASDDFAMVDGVTEGQLRIVLDQQRRIDIVAGTPGEITCEVFDRFSECAIVADLLGDAVIWFALIPAQPRDVVALPAPAEVREDGWLLLTNGWEVRRAEVITRVCDEQDTESLAEFIRTFGDNARTSFSFAEQQAVRVICADTVEPTTTTSTTIPLVTISPDELPNDTQVDEGELDGELNEG